MDIVWKSVSFNEARTGKIRVLSKIVTLAQHPHVYQISRKRNLDKNGKHGAMANELINFWILPTKAFPDSIRGQLGIRMLLNKFDCSGPQLGDRCKIPSQPVPCGGCPATSLPLRLEVCLGGGGMAESHTPNRCNVHQTLWIYEFYVRRN